MSYDEKFRRDVFRFLSFDGFLAATAAEPAFTTTVFLPVANTFGARTDGRHIGGTEPDPTVPA